jgi:RimJ/RimL family protein N-acetyltransferase
VKINVFPPSSDNAPIVFASGLVLCELEPRDVEGLLENDRDSETASRFGWEPADPSPAKAERWVEETARMWRAGERAVFAIRESLDGPYLGTVEARQRPHRPGCETGEPVIELTWTVRPSQRGRQIAQRAVSGLVAWCGEIGIREVWANVENSNPASLRVATSAGFQPVSDAGGWLSLRAPTRRPS